MNDWDNVIDEDRAKRMMDARERRKKIESEQRARMNARLANRPKTPATEDFDLPAPND